MRVARDLLENRLRIEREEDMPDYSYGESLRLVQRRLAIYPVIIADRDTPMGDLLPVIEAARKAGYEEVRFMTIRR